jgi:Tol biopolymer transport system component
LSVSINLPAEMRLIRGQLLQRSPAILIHGQMRRPDGSEDPTARLYHRSFESYDLTPIAGTERAESFTLSPDERWAAIVRGVSPGSAEHHIVKVPIDGSSPAVTVGEWQPGWEGMTWLADGDLLIGTAQGNQIIRVPSGGGSAKPPIALALEGGTMGFPRLEEELPGGRGVLAVVATWGARGYQEDVWLIDPTTGKGRRLVENGGAPEYQVETGYLVFSRQSSLMAARLDLATATVQGEVIALFDGLRSAAWSNGAFRVSIDGHLMFQPGGRIGADRRVVVVEPNRDVTPFVADARSYEAAIDASADGKRVAVVIPTAGGTYDTWTASTDRPGLRRTIAIPNADAAGALWSPNGEWLAFSRQGRDADDGIYLQRSDGSGAARLLAKSPATDEFLIATGWTGDGLGVVAMHIKGGRADIVVVPVSSDGSAGQPRPLRATPASEYDPTISPDGNVLAFGSDETGAQELYLAALSGGAIVGQPTLIAGGTKGGVPRWSRDGRRLFFAQASPDRIMSVVVERTPSLRALTPAQAFDMRALRLDPRVWAVLPGDRLVGIQRGVGEDEVTSFQLILHWLDTVRGRLTGAAR